MDLTTVPVIDKSPYKLLENACVIHFIGCSPKSSVASSRIARFLAHHLDIPLVDTLSEYNKNPKFYDTVFIVNGPFLYCDFRKEIEAVATNAKTVIYIQNDFNIDIRPGIATRDQWAYWTTVPAFCKKEGIDSYVNWNFLTYDPIEPRTPTKEGILYYGAFRKGRIPYINKYLSSDLYPIFVSSTTKHLAKFKELNPNIQFVPKFTNVIDQSADYTATIYMEDKWSHDNYCSPANRFYECLSAGIAILFDKSTFRTMDIAGYNIQAFIVDSPEDVVEKLKMVKQIAEAQLIWRRDYRNILIKRIKIALDGLEYHVYGG